MKRFYTFVCVSLLAVAAVAQQLTEEEAMRRAVQYLNSSSRQAKARGAVSRGSLKAARVETKGTYAFNLDGGGYVIASADSRTLPVLGYSDTGTFDWEQLPENMRSWLKSYDKAIATLGSRTDFVDGNQVSEDSEYSENSEPRKTSDLAHPAIEPMLKTIWYQTAPYNDRIPLYDGADPEWQGKQCVVGCVATAMASIMNYYQWPKHETAAIRAYDIPTEWTNPDTGEKVEKICHYDELPPITFDWEHMIDCYYKKDKDGNKTYYGTDEEKEAVAQLMLYCAQSVEMEYTPEGSGSFSPCVSEALKYYFDYGPSARCELRNTFNSIAEWEDLIYGELADQRPVLYAGLENEVGHAFVCDGYDGEGLFHIDWGWAGQNNGYYSLSVLNPFLTAIPDTASTYVGFTMNQEAVVGIMPRTAQDGEASYVPTVELKDLTINETYADEEEGGEEEVGYQVCVTYFYSTVMHPAQHVNVALGTIDDDGNLTPVFASGSVDVISPKNWYLEAYVTIDPAYFGPEELVELFPMYSLPELEGNVWHTLGNSYASVFAGYYGGDFCVMSGYIPLTMTSFRCTGGNAIIDEKTDMTATFANDSDEDDYMNKITVVPFYYGDALSSEPVQGEWMENGAYIPAGGEADVLFSFVAKQLGYVVFCFYDWQMNYFGRKTMKITAPNDIDAVQTDDPSQPGEWHTLQGVNLGTEQPSEPGIYMKDGKKFRLK